MVTGRKKSLYYRQKILLALLEVFGGQLKKTDLQKYLFLFTQEYQRETGATNLFPTNLAVFPFSLSPT